MVLIIIIVFININNLQREKQSLRVLPIFQLNWQKSTALVEEAHSHEEHFAI